MLKYQLFPLLLLLICKAFSQNVTVEKHNLTYEVDKSYQVRVLEEKIITIHNERGFEHARFVEWSSPQQRFNKVQIEIYDTFGNRIKRYNRMDLLEMSTASGYEIHDTKLLTLKPNYKTYPFQVKTYTEKTLKGFIGLPRWMPRDDFNMAVKQSRLKLDISNSIPVRMLEKNLKTDKILNVGDRTVYEWNVTDLSAVQETVDVESFLEEQPSVRIAPEKFSYDGFEGKLETWTEFGNWYSQLNEGRNSLTVKTRRYLDGLPKEDVRKTIERIYRYMQSRTRYISIQLGIGGFQSMPALTVDEEGYGDCKALSNYMKSMLQYVQIPSNFVLVKAGRNEMDIDKDFPSNQFNHVFLGIPFQQDTIYLECTSQSQPFNYLGNFTDDRNVLWVEKDNSKIIRTPVYNALYNQENTVATIDLKEDGAGSINLTKTHEGYFASNFEYYINRTNDQLESHHYNQFSYSDFEILDVKVKPRDKSYPRFKRKFSLSVNKLARSTRGRLIIPTNLLEPIDAYLQVDQSDGFTQIKRGFSTMDSVTVNLPADYFLPEIAENVEISSLFGSYRFYAERTANGLTYKREVTLFKGAYRGENFEKFYQFYNEIKRIDRRKMICQSKT